MRQVEFTLPSYGRGIHLITDDVVSHLAGLPVTGMLHLFIKHTSAGICINENADPTVRTDLNKWFDMNVREGELYYEHTYEGPDDMPAHIKSILTGHEVTIPITNGRLNLGTWQGIYLCEFRNGQHRRSMVATIMG